MSDRGTIAWTSECVYPGFFQDSSSGSTILTNVAYQTMTGPHQAIKPLTQQASKLKDLRDLDPQVLSEIHEIYFTKIFEYVRYRVSDEALAEDLASETFLRLLDAVHDKKGPNSSIRGWLFGTASNLVSDHFRQHYREDEQLTEDISEFQKIDAGDSFKRFEQQDYLNNALKQLTQEQQHVIALRFGSGMSIEETARVLEKNENAVKAMQFRAIRSLRSELEVEV
jgi:RNA polymerase sigma-70 factor (ECF subfamily)